MVIDSDSTDRTARVAARAGARVHQAETVLTHLGRREGKGEAMWKSLAVTSSEIIVFLDADLTTYSPAYVTGLVGPLLTLPHVQLVKAAYDRTLTLDGRVVPGGGGRVTELMARPLLNALWPELAGIVQPLAGEYAARRDALERVPFNCGYGVEIGLLVDLLELYGLSAFAQVDLGVRGHRNKPDADLALMAATVLHTALRRLPSVSAAAGMTGFSRTDGSFQPLDCTTAEPERPPFGSLEETLRVAG